MPSLLRSEYACSGSRRVLVQPSLPFPRASHADRLAPAQPGGQNALEVTAQPLLQLGTLEFGIVGSASRRHSFEWPGTAELQLDPMSIAFAENQAVFPGAISGSFS